MMHILPTWWQARGGVWFGLMAAGLLWANSAHGQLRVVTYNTAGPSNSDLEIVLRAIGEEEINGIAKPIDVLLLQEQDSPFSDTQTFVTYLNSVYGAGTYAHGFVSGLPSGALIRQTVVYNTQTVDLISELAFGDTASSTDQERQTLRYQLRPDGYDSTADFYAYNSHYKSSTDANSQIQRNAEATAIRANYDELGDGTHAIYAGDHNIYTSTEAAFQTLTDGSLYSGAGQAIDPINQIGDWHDNASFAEYHTQSPCTSGCGTTGGMDDRFDWQFVTDEFMDGEGISYIGPSVPGMEGLDDSYRAFGNAGVSLNTNINNAANLNAGTGYPFDGVTTYTRTQVLDALHAGTDHIPVVADYQVPAILGVEADSVPLTLDQGETFDLEVTVSNLADVVAAIGADELDYDLTSSGDLSGSFLDQTDNALGSGIPYQVSFDTSTPGMKSGMITVVSDSQGVGSGPGVTAGMWTLNVNYEVLAAAGLVGDYNDDGAVDAADYAMWRDNIGQPGTVLNNRDSENMGVVSEDDFASWREHFGDVLGSGAGSASAVPEPASWLMLLLGVCMARLASGRLGSWTRKG